MGQFANFWYNASHWHHIFQIGLFNFKRHLDQLLLCILTCTSRWLSLKHPLETNSCWQHVTLTSCQHVYLKKNFQGHPEHLIMSSNHTLMHIWYLILKLHLFKVNVTLTTWCQCDFTVYHLCTYFNEMSRINPTITSVIQYNIQYMKL